jgi:tRNA pseudouridine55 synthase
MNGVFPVDKPEGPTSHDVVVMARRGLGIRRIGHTGTLDPFASGLLLLCVGKATRLAEYLTGLDKSYEATARLGVRTTTLDRTGDVVDTTADLQDLQPDPVRAAFEGQAGSRLQRPPAYSAKKVGGRRAYDLARAGTDVELASVQVEIMELDVTGIDGPDVHFRIRCSSGTYVRTVAAEAGEALGVGAHLTRLRRTAVGRFRVEDAVPVEGLSDPQRARDARIDPLAALAHLPAVTVNDEQAAELRHGRGVTMAGLPIAPAVAVEHQGALLAVAESDGASLRPRKVLV